MQRSLPLLTMAGLLVALGCSSSTGLGRSSHPAGLIAGTLELEGRPHGVSIAPNGIFCVSQIDAGSITCGSLGATSATLEETIAVGAGSAPAHVALDPTGRFAYTANQFAATVSVVDVQRGEVVETVPLGDGGFNVVADRARTYVTTASGALYVIDAETRQAIAQLAVGAAANGLALDTLDHVLYVSSIDAGTVTAINTNTYEVTGTYQVGAGAQRIALAPDRATLYVASMQSGAVVVDLATGETSTIPGVPAGTVGLALSADGARLYLTNPPRGTLQIVDANARRVLTTFSGLGSPRNVAFSADGATALVTNEAGTVIVIR
ncbi:MAG TPA: beta-propeller fold lactonase family protein [Gemmatimonadaceae bacterium]